MMFRWIQKQSNRHRNQNHKLEQKKEAKRSKNHIMWRHLNISKISSGLSFSVDLRRKLKMLLNRSTTYRVMRFFSLFLINCFDTFLERAIFFRSFKAKRIEIKMNGWCAHKSVLLNSKLAIGQFVPTSIIIIGFIEQNKCASFAWYDFQNGTTSFNNMLAIVYVLRAYLNWWSTLRELNQYAVIGNVLPIASKHITYVSSGWTWSSIPYYVKQHLTVC